LLVVRRGDVLSAWSGIRPLVLNPNVRDTQSIARNHIIEVSNSNMITIAGKYLFICYLSTSFLRFLECAFITYMCVSKTGCHIEIMERFGEVAAFIYSLLAFKLPAANSCEFNVTHLQTRFLKNILSWHKQCHGSSDLLWTWLG
jgi:hypothetical protein